MSQQVPRYGPWTPVTTPREVLLTVGPLLAWVKDRYDTPEGGWTLSTLAVALHMSNRRLRRWLLLGIRLDEADPLAIRLGAHPAEIWGRAFYADLLDGPELEMAR